MTTHLPECWATDPSDPPAWCICDELRACEERVISEAVQRVEAFGLAAQGAGVGVPDLGCHRGDQGRSRRD